MAKKPQKKARNGDYAPQPVTRWQKFWAALAGVIQNHPDPNTENEYWLAKTADRIAAIEEGGGGGGGSTEIYYSGLWTIWKDNNTKTIIAAIITQHPPIIIGEQSGSLYKSDPQELPYPAEILDYVDINTLYVAVNVYHNNYQVFATDVKTYNLNGENLISYRVTSGTSRPNNPNYQINALLICHIPE